MKLSLRGAALAAAMFVAVPAQAVVIAQSSVTIAKTDIGSAFSVAYDGRGGTPVAPVKGLMAWGSFALNAVSADGKSWVFGYTLDNRSSGAVKTSRLSGFGFNVNHTLDLTKSLGGGLFTEVGTGNVPNAQPNVDICLMAVSPKGGDKKAVKSGASAVKLNGQGGGANGGGDAVGNCSGGAGGGLGIDDAATSGTFTLAFANAQTSLALSNFYDRYQSLSVTGNSIQSATGLGSAYIPAVPEPQTWATMALGFGLIGAAARRRRRAAHAA